MIRPALLSTTSGKPRLLPRLLAAASIAWGGPTLAANRSWDDAGNSASKLWSDNGNWNPDGAVSASDDIFIGNLANAAGDQTLFDVASQMQSLTISNGAGVINSTDGGATPGATREIIVNGATTIGGAGSGLTVYGRSGDGFDTNTLTVNSGALVTLNSQPGIGTAVVEVDSGLFDVNSGGEVIGNGRIDLEDTSPGGPFTLLQNDGEITATSLGLVFGTPVATTLQITASSADARFDWDGSIGNGVLNARGNATLDIDVSTEGDAFDGVMNLSAGSTIDIEHAWSLDTGEINANTPAFGFIIIGQDPFPGPAARIAGAGWTMTGGAINVDDAWDTLQFDSPVTASAGTVNNNGTMIFNADATFQSGVDFNMISGNDSGASLVVNATVNIDTPDFNLDGQGLTANVTTINAGGNLDLDLGAGADEDFHHTINLNGGELDVTTSDNDWGLANGGEINAAGGVTSSINGETFVVEGDVNVTGDSTLRVNATTEYESTADVVVEAGSVLNHISATYRGGGFTGGGVLKKGSATIEADTTWATGAVDLDDGSITVLDNAKLTVTTDSIDDAGDGIDTTITVADLGELEINLNGGADVVFDDLGALVYNGNAGGSTPIHASATGSALRFDAGSELTINGDANLAARIKLNGGVMDINDATENARLIGGTLAPGDTNEISGGVINGPGELQIGTGVALRGHGAVNAQVDGDGSAQLIAEGGTLSVTGGVQDIGTIGTAGAGSRLDVTTPWSTGVADTVLLERGELTGAPITNDNPSGIQGQGLVTSRVQNNTLLISNAGGTLVVDNAANDWDGAAGAGALRASNGTLELRDNSAFLFTGSVRADAGGVVFANGFELEFDPGSTLQLNGGTYRSTHATDLGGTVNVAGGVSRLAIAGTAVFENGSNTTLTSDLQLDNTATVVTVGAAFSGGGELVNLNSRALNLLDGANVGVQVTNEGEAEIAGAVSGRADVADFVQTATGALNIDLLGTALGDFDRLVTAGIAQLAGELDLNVIGAFNPALGDVFTVVSAAGGRLGAFDTLDASFAPLDAGLLWDVVYNPTNVQVEVVLNLPGDFNNDGSVDAADYTVWRDNLGAGVTLPGDPTPGTVTQADHAVWAANYGATAPVPVPAFALATAAVPEPGAALLTTLGALAAGFASRRRRPAA